MRDQFLVVPVPENVARSVNPEVTVTVTVSQMLRTMPEYVGVASLMVPPAGGKAKVRLQGKGSFERAWEIEVRSNSLEGGVASSGGLQFASRKRKKRDTAATSSLLARGVLLAVWDWGCMDRLSRRHISS